MTTTRTHEEVVAEFVDELRLEQTDEMRFRGRSGRFPHGRVFGGLVLAHGSIAAASTVERDRNQHSLHANFLRGGTSEEPIDYEVTAVRDGRSFSVRRVDVIQKGGTICEMVVSFARPEEGIEHADAMPDVPPPEDVPPHVWEPPPGIDLDTLAPWPTEMRPITPIDAVARPGEDLRAIGWVGLLSPLPNDALIHGAALAYYSDADSLEAVFRRHGGDFAHGASASLDHSLWFHRPIRWDGWLLFVTESPVAHASRALSIRRIYTRDGTHVATMAQECIFRRPR
jgi:acyl-CoA thioesterase-2